MHAYDPDPRIEEVVMTQACVPGWQDWVRLQLTPGVGLQTGLRVFRRFGTATAFFASDNGASGDLLSPAQALALKGVPPTWALMCARVRDWLASARPGEQHALWTLDHPAYPSALRDTYDPPLCLFARGQCERIPERALALVGSRNPTRQGLENAHRFAASLAGHGWCVVSGLALGVDGAAHQGALSSQRAGSTLAVVGTGLDLTYPASHRVLADEIASQGLLLSELMPGTPPLAAHFPRRNRLIAALSQATLVVEASLRSGSLITAQQALELGREVMAVPGSIHAPQSRGCHALIKQGAKLVESIDDVFEELKMEPVQSSVRETTPTHRAAPPPALQTVWQALGHDPVPLEQLCSRIHQETAQVLAGLLSLELGGWIERLPGGRFQRVR